MRVLILGGTTEARLLIEALAIVPGIAPILSLAGRTQHPLAPSIASRSGGFGGVAGLQAYLLDARIEVVIDATHPFAAQMSRHAVVACQALKLPLARLERLPWTAQTGDLWQVVPDLAGAMDALDGASRRVFLTHGRLGLADFAQRLPQHFYLVRAIDPPPDFAALPKAKLMLARGPFALEDELALMLAERIDILVTKMSGGRATYGKIEAARKLQIGVIMLDRPVKAAAQTFVQIEDLLGWLADHRGAT